jgi:predicted DNA-binding protein (MmcQ/YjbR family)
MTRRGAGMTVAQLEALCGNWPGVAREIKRGVDLVFGIDGKMFALAPVDGSEGGRLSLKVPDERLLEPTDQPGIIPAPYLARAHWISITEPECSGTAELAAFIRDSYRLVRAKLTLKRQAELAPLPAIDKGKA